MCGWGLASQPAESPPRIFRILAKIENAARVKRGCGDHSTYLSIEILQHRSNPVLQPRTSGKQKPPPRPDPSHAARDARPPATPKKARSRRDTVANAQGSTRIYKATSSAAATANRELPRRLPGTFRKIKKGFLAINLGERAPGDDFRRGRVFRHEMGDFGSKSCHFYAQLLRAAKRNPTLFIFSALKLVKIGRENGIFREKSPENPENRPPSRPISPAKTEGQQSQSKQASKQASKLV